MKIKLNPLYLLFFCTPNIGWYMKQYLIQGNSPFRGLICRYVFRSTLLMYRTRSKS